MIREMKLDDYEQVKQLQKQIYLQHLKERNDIYIESESYFDFEYFASLLNGADNFNFVYENDGKILGILLAVTKPESKIPFMKKRKVAYIDSIVVLNKNQHQGIGKKLFQYFENYVKENQFESIELNVWSFNQNALKFYKSMGMVEQSIKMGKRIKNL